MAALSDYLESGILNHLFRINPFEKPANISIALTSSVSKDNDMGSTIPEIPSSVNNGSVDVSTNYSRVNLQNPSQNGNLQWSQVGDDTSTAFSVFSNDPEHSGFFYPIYLSESSAKANDTNAVNNNTQAVIYEFSEFPGTNFYSPATITVSGTQEDPGYENYTGNGFIKNASQIVFNPATTDWGWVSGVAILDSPDHQSGNLLMYAELNNPRYVYTGDTIKFDVNALEINLN